MLNPETIDFVNLPFLSLSDRALLPRIAAVYFVLDSSDVVQYIGQTKDLKTRWISHHHDGDLSPIKEFRIAYLAVDTNLLLEVEKALIAWFHPRLNQPLSIKNLRRPQKVSRNDPSRQERSALGTFHSETPLSKVPRCVALPLEADAIVCRLPDRSAQLRRWILEGMQRDGLLDVPDPN